MEIADELISLIKPEVALLTHFGLRTLRTGPDHEANWIQERTGIETIAAKDGMSVKIENEVRFKIPADRKPEEPSDSS